MSAITAEEFVACLRAEILSRNLGNFRRSLEGDAASSEGPTAWPGTAAFFALLERQEFMDAARQIMVDAEEE